MLTGRRVITSYQPWLRNIGLDSTRQEADLRSIYRFDDRAADLLEEYRVDYVVIGEWEERELEANVAAFMERYPLKATIGEYRVFAVSGIGPRQRRNDTGPRRCPGRCILRGSGGSAAGLEEDDLGLVGERADGDLGLRLADRLGGHLVKELLRAREVLRRAVDGRSASGSRSSDRSGRRPRRPRPGVSVVSPPTGTSSTSIGPELAELLVGEEVAEIAEVADVHAVDLDREDHVLAPRRSGLAVVIGADPGDQQVAELVLARPGQGQARGDRAGVAVVGVGMADRQQRRRRACRRRSRSTGGHGSVMTVASLPFRRKQARPYQVISIGEADGSRR